VNGKTIQKIGLYLQMGGSFFGDGVERLTLGRPTARALRHTGAGGCGADTLLASGQD